jgi:hypothetical protein
MQKEAKVHEVKSTIELKRKGIDEGVSVSKMMSKAGEFVTNLFARLGDYFTKSNQKLDGYIGELRGMLNDGGKEEENLFNGLNEDVNTEMDIANRVEMMKADIKKMSRATDARSEAFQADTSIAPKVQKEIEAVIKEFVDSPKTSEWPAFQAVKDDQAKLAEAKREMVFSEIANRLYNFFYNSGSGSFVRLYQNPYKIQVVTEMKKVADAVKFERLSKALQNSIDHFKNPNQESAIDKLRAQHGVQPKNVAN